MLSRRACGIAIEIVRSPAVAASASRIATWTRITPGPAWSTISYLFASASVSDFWKRLLLEKKSFWSDVEGQILLDEIADLLNLPPG